VISVRISVHGRQIQQIEIQIHLCICPWLSLCYLPVGWPITHNTLGQVSSTIFFLLSGCLRPPFWPPLWPQLIAQVATTAAAADGYFLIVFSRFLIKAQLDFQFSCNFKAAFCFRTWRETGLHLIGRPRAGQTGFGSTNQDAEDVFTIPIPMAPANYSHRAQFAGSWLSSASTSVLTSLRIKLMQTASHRHHFHTFGRHIYLPFKRASGFMNRPERWPLMPGPYANEFLASWMGHQATAQCSGSLLPLDSLRKK